MKIIRAISIFFFIGTLPLNAVAAPKVIDHTIIYKNKNSYTAFPNLFLASDGRTLVSTFTTRFAKSHADSTGGNKTAVSTDGGNSWNLSEEIYVYPGFKTAGGKFVQPAVNGWKQATPDVALKMEKDGIFLHKENGKSFYALGAVVKTSDNNGISWTSKPIVLDNHVVLMMHNLSGYLKTKSGIRILAVYGKKQVGERDQVYFIRSDDNGNNWNTFPLDRSMKNRNIMGFNETALAELDDGRLVAVMRPDPDSIGYLYVSISTDMGKTWSEARATKLWGFPANLTVYRGRLIVSYGYRKSPMGVRVAEINPDTLKVMNALVLREDAVGRPADVGYPMTLNVKDNVFVTTYYITTNDGITHVAASRWRLD